MGRPRRPPCSSRRHPRRRRRAADLTTSAEVAVERQHLAPHCNFNLVERWLRAGTRDWSIAPISPEVAAAVAASLLRSEVDRVEQVPSYAGDQVFRVAHADRVSFLKFTAMAGTHLDLAQEVAVVKKLAALGMPVPAIEGADLNGSLAGHPAVLLADVGGAPLSGVEPEFLAAGAILRSVHDVPVAGFGSMFEGEPLRGEDSTWSATIRRRAEALDRPVDAGLVEERMADRVRAAVEVSGHLLDQVTVPCLLHGDFTPRHVFAADGRITGIIDWGDATAGDSLWDFGRVAHAGTLARDVDHGLALVRRLRDGYGDRFATDEHLVAKVLLYAAVFAAWSMAAEFAAGAPWPPFWDYQSVALVAILDRFASIDLPA